jgi:hypothetical protein
MNRIDYIKGIVTHREYYASVAEAAGITYPPDHPLVIRAREALTKGDWYLNTIPLREWDAIAPLQALQGAFLKHDDFLSDTGAVCVMKEVVRQAVEKSA